MMGLMARRNSSSLPRTRRYSSWPQTASVRLIFSVALCQQAAMGRKNIIWVLTLAMTLARRRGSSKYPSISFRVSLCRVMTSRIRASLSIVRTTSRKSQSMGVGFPSGEGRPSRSEVKTEARRFLGASTQKGSVPTFFAGVMRMEAISSEWVCVGTMLLKSRATPRVSKG